MSSACAQKRCNAFVLQRVLALADGTRWRAKMRRRKKGEGEDETTSLHHFIISLLLLPLPRRRDAAVNPQQITEVTFRNTSPLGVFAFLFFSFFTSDGLKGELTEERRWKSSFRNAPNFPIRSHLYFLVCVVVGVSSGQSAPYCRERFEKRTLQHIGGERGFWRPFMGKLVRKMEFTFINSINIFTISQPNFKHPKRLK